MRKVFISIFILIITTSVYSQEIKKIKITDLEKTIADSKTPLVISFWATFCAPCIEEIPYFQETVKKHMKDSIKLLLVSLDMREAYPVQIRKTIVKRKITAPVQWLDETNADYFCPRVDNSWSGEMPASLFINNKTGYRKFIGDQLSKDKLQKEIKSLLGKAN